MPDTATFTPYITDTVSPGQAFSAPQSTTGETSDVIGRGDLGGYSGFSNAGGRIPTYIENNVFLGVPNVTHDTMPYIEPFIGGYGRVFCLCAPPFFEENLKGVFIRMIERMCKGLDGISNYELKTTEITYGNNAESYNVPTGISRGNNTFTLKFQEVKGGLFRRLIRYWVTGIADLGTGYGTYHGKTYSDPSAIFRYSPINHTSIFLYALTDNSGGAYGLDSLEFASMWVASYPNVVDNAHLNWTQGEHAPVELAIPFFGIFHENNTINAFAAEMLLRSKFYRDNYDTFNLGTTVWNKAAERISQEDDTDSAIPGFEPYQYNAYQPSWTNNDTITEPPGQESSI